MQLMAILLQQQAEGSGWSGMLMIVAMIVIFYFFMIRPQSKKQKEIKKAREAMKKGDKVVTAGGIYGSIKTINAESGIIHMEIAPGVVIRISREQVFPAGAETPAKSDAKSESKSENKED